MAAAIKELFEGIVETTGRAFPTEAAAREGLESLQSTLIHESTPVESVLKRVLARASVREVNGDNGAVVFKVLIHPGGAEESVVPAIIRGLRSGNLESVARALNITPAELGSRVFRQQYSNYARDIFPEARIAEESVAAERALPVALSKSSRDLRPETVDELMQAIGRDKELEKLVTRLSDHIAKSGGRRFKYVSTFFLLSGVTAGVASTALALHEQAKRSAGCWRIYLDPVTRKMSSCKILQASCRNLEINEGVACDRTPPGFHSEMCRDAAPDADCLSCDPTADPGSKQYIPPSRYLDPHDFYVCRPVASVGEVLGRLVADVPDLAVDAAHNVATTVSSVWNSLTSFILAAGATVLVVLLVYTFVISKFRGERDRK